MKTKIAPIPVKPYVREFMVMLLGSEKLLASPKSKLYVKIKCILQGKESGNLVSKETLNKPPIYLDYSNLEVSEISKYQTSLIAEEVKQVFKSFFFEYMKYYCKKGGEKEETLIEKFCIVYNINKAHSIELKKLWFYQNKNTFHLLPYLKIGVLAFELMSFKN